MSQQSKSRKEVGRFTSLADLCEHVDGRSLGRKTLEALIKAGSLDPLGPNRATLSAELDRAMHLGEQNSRAMSVGQVDLFGLSPAEHGTVDDWTEAQRLAGERETLGLYLSGHPITPYEPDLKFLVSARLVDVGGPKPVTAEVVESLRPELEPLFRDLHIAPAQVDAMVDIVAAELRSPVDPAAHRALASMSAGFALGDATAAKVADRPGAPLEPRPLGAPPERAGRGCRGLRPLRFLGGLPPPTRRLGRPSAPPPPIGCAPCPSR